MGRLFFSVFIILLVLGNTVLGMTFIDERSWNEAFESFMASSANSGQLMTDGKRLLELDQKKAAPLLLQYLDKSHPSDLRLKAIVVLGRGSIKEAIPYLKEIANDPDEPDELRCTALNPGLRYMHDGEALAVGRHLFQHSNKAIRIEAYWVLSEHGTDSAVDALTQAIRTSPLHPMELKTIIYALKYSKNPRAGQIVYENVSFEQLFIDNYLLSAYVETMTTYKILQAKPQIVQLLSHADQSIRISALHYFANFPSDDIVDDIVDFVKRTDSEWWKNRLYGTIFQFINAEEISPMNKELLKKLQEEHHIRKIEWVE
jgi:HEAT repeat protein